MYTVVHTTLGPASTVGMQAVIPGVLQALCSQSHQRRSICTHPLKSGTRTAVVACLVLPWELWKQPKPWSRFHVHVLTKTIAAKAGPVLATGVPIVHSDVLQVLSLQSQSWWCGSHSCGARALLSAPHLHVGSPLALALACSQSL